MSAERFTSAEIAGYLVNDLFHFRRNVIVSNVSHALLPWEADLVVMTTAGYLSEVEIKVSIADLKRDPKKAKWRGWQSHHDRFKARWFAMPEAVWAHKDAAACVPETAGVIVFHKPEHLWSYGAKVVRPAIENRAARALSVDEQFQLARLGSMRHWSKLARESRKSAALAQQEGSR